MWSAGKNQSNIQSSRPRVDYVYIQLECVVAGLHSDGVCLALIGQQQQCHYTVYNRVRHGNGYDLRPKQNLVLALCLTNNQTLVSTAT